MDPPTWGIKPCWTEPLRAARRLPIGESIFPFEPLEQSWDCMAQCGRKMERIASADRGSMGGRGEVPVVFWLPNGRPSLDADTRLRGDRLGSRNHGEGGWQEDDS